MIHLTISRGRIKRTSSLEALKNDLYLIMEYEPRLVIDINDFLKGIISIDSKDNYSDFDILKVLTKHCSYFKVEIDEEDYYETRFTSEYLITTSFFEWNGKDLYKRQSNYFGRTHEKENYNWILK